MKKKRLLIISDSINVFTGFANVARHISTYLHDTEKYEIAYYCWFHQPLNDIKPPFPIYTTLKDHSKCCGRGPVVMRQDPDQNPKYFRHQQGVLLPIQDGPPCWQGHNMEHDKYGYESVHGVILDFKPDLVLTIGDTWMTFHLNQLSVRNCYNFTSYCFSPDTDIMTKEGLKNISDVKEGDFVFSIEPKTNKCSYKKVIRTTEREYNGNMISLLSSRINQLITPDHRVLLNNGAFLTADNLLTSSISKLPIPSKVINHYGDNKITVNMLDYCDDDSFILIPTKHKNELCNSYLCTICGYNGITDNPKEVKCSQCRSRQVETHTGIFNKTFLESHHYHHELVYKFKKSELSDEQLTYIMSLDLMYNSIRLRGADDEHGSLPLYLNKHDLLRLGGWFVSEGSIENKKCHVCHLAQEKYISILEKDIKDVDIRFSKVHTGYKIYGKIMYNFFTKNFGKDSYNKKIDNNIFNICSVSELEILFDRMLLGDGSYNKSSYYTVCKELADNVLKLCFIIGNQAIIYYDDRIYRISIRNPYDLINIKSHMVEKQTYNGIVKCLSVEDNGTVLAGRNGRLNYIGQCPIDGEPMPHVTDMGGLSINWIDAINKADKPIAFCDFGRDTMIKTGEKYGTDLKKVGVIYHGVDLLNYRPLQNKAELRKKWFPEVKDDQFLVGFFSRNQPRKAVHKWFEAIALGVKKGYWNKDTIKMYAHFPIKDCGWAIPDLITTHDLKDIVITRDLKVGVGPTDAEMNELYNCCDLTTLPTRGEGFGMCLHLSSILHTKNKATTIRNVRIGDEILGLNGKYNKITNITKRKVNESYFIQPTYTLPTIVTKEHPYYVSKSGNINDLKWTNVEQIDDTDWLYYPKPKYDNVLPEYINISDYIKTDINFDGDYIYKKMGFSPYNKLSYLKICSKYNTTKKIVEKAISYIKNNGMYDNHKSFGHISTISSPNVIKLVSLLLNDKEFKLPTPNKIIDKIKVDDNFLEFCGWYLAEGSNDKFSRVDIDLNLDELHIAKRLGKWIKSTFKCEYVVEITGEHKCRLRINSSLLGEFFGNLLGNGCFNKTIPWILENGGNKLGKLFSGLFHGDGNFNFANNSITLSTTSISLNTKVRDILSSVGILSSIHKVKKRSHMNYTPRINRIVTCYVNKFLSFIGDNNITIKDINMDLCREFDDCFLLKLQKKKLIKKQITVMDISVENTHSFVANGVLVHNTVSESMSAGVPTLISAYSAHHDWTSHATARIKIQALDAEPLTNINRAIVDVEDYCEKIFAFFNNISIEEYIEKFGPITDYRDELKLIEDTNDT